jgi:exodeoxyribonuclease VII small subunit
MAKPSASSKILKMKSKLTYQKAFEELQDIVNAIENNEVVLDELSAKIEKANELILFCKEKLRSTEAQVNDAMKKASGN